MLCFLATRIFTDGHCNSEFGGMDCTEEVDVLKRENQSVAGDYGPENTGWPRRQPGAITKAIGSGNQSGVAQRSVEQSSAPLASQELVLELVLVLVLVQAASCNLTRAWPTSIPMTPLTVCWCGSSRAGIVAVKDTVDNRITVVVTS